MPHPATGWLCDLGGATPFLGSSFSISEVNGLDLACFWHLQVALVLQAYPRVPQPPSDLLLQSVSALCYLRPTRWPVSRAVDLCLVQLCPPHCLVRSGSDSSPDTCLEQRLLSCFTYFVPGALQAPVHLFPRTTCLQMKKLRQTLSTCHREQSWGRNES